ncbi:MAG: hypothetical protein NC408_04765 [Candidatus Gastranaerophilales bacterium]|nr:hypothetical protein [Candidatus Gastranaerophilales bacterium]MCM1073212.1 hypothetical protein [Bacteroides sp.]
MHIQKTNNTSFKAIRLASAEARFNGAVNKFNLYKITQEDRQYIEKLRNEINLKELMPKLKPEDYKLWEYVLRITLSTYDETILLTKDEKPCGALRYKKTPRDYSIIGRVTWPIETGKREPFAGKVLTTELFRLFLQDNLKVIRTCVARHNPFDTISKCMEMGFSSCGGDDYNELMAVTRARIENVLEKFKDIIIIEDADSSMDSEVSLQ